MSVSINHNWISQDLLWLRLCNIQYSTENIMYKILLRLFIIISITYTETQNRTQSAKYNNTSTRRQAQNTLHVRRSYKEHHRVRTEEPSHQQRARAHRTAQSAVSFLILKFRCRNFIRKPIQLYWTTVRTFMKYTCCTHIYHQKVCSGIDIHIYLNYRIHLWFE